MSIINQNNLASYFSLNNTSTSTTSTNTGTTSAAPSLADTLAAVQNSNSSNTNSSCGNSFLLDLSPEAKNYLAGLSDSSSNSATSSSSDSFILSNAQQDKLKAIIAKYKDEPYTQDTFDQMQNDLEAAGLGTDQLNAEQQIRSMNPTAMFISALNGTQADVSSLTGGIDSTAAQTRATNFMQSVIDQWKQISTTVNDTAPATGDTTTTAGA